MKTILTAALLLTAGFMVAPGASACIVSDPTGTTYTCVDQYDYSYGDCEAGSGTYYHGTHAYVLAPGTTYIGVVDESSCLANPGYNYQGSGTIAWAFVDATQTWVVVGHHEQTGSWGDHCDNYVHTSETGSVSLGCP